MPIESQKPRISNGDRAITEIFKATATVYWPKYFDQWTVVLIEKGYSQMEVYNAVDEAKKNVREKAKTKQHVDKNDIIMLVRLIVRYYKEFPQSPIEKIH